MGLRRAVGRYDYRRGYARVKRSYAARPWTFKERVKQIVDQESGIHTAQRVTTGEVNWIAAQRGYTAVATANAAFYQLLSVLKDGSEEQAKVRSCSTIYTFSNANNFPVRCSMYEVVCRRQCAQDIFVLAADQGVLQTTIHVDPTVGNPFRRFFKITNRTTTYLQAGQQMDVTARLFYRTPKTITGDTDASNAYPYARGSKVVMCYFEGPPSEDAGTKGSIVNCPPGTINYVYTQKCTWYYDEDNDPVTTTVNDMPVATVADTFRIYTDVTLQTEANDGP